MTPLCEELLKESRGGFYQPKEAKKYVVKPVPTSANNSVNFSGRT
ncbi:hypothetical protein [Microseira wollei]|nr:hypothetical protein [Microseira wollei]